MVVAVNDISFLWGFDTAYKAKEALIQFGNVALGLKDERVSKVNTEIDIINSEKVSKSLMLAPDYPLIKALLDIKEEDKERFLLILQILTQCGEENQCEDEISIGEYSSKHIAKYRNDFIISLISDKAFEKTVVNGHLNQTEECKIRNLSNEDHKYTYWEELGFREYELNKKHGNRVYYRCGGEKVNVAPETGWKFIFV